VRCEAAEFFVVAVPTAPVSTLTRQVFSNTIHHEKRAGKTRKKRMSGVEFSGVDA
jgi:hypothetical protein